MKYRLLKPMPNIKEGTIYIKAPKEVAKDNCTYYPDIVGCKNERWMLHKDWVENNPEWFEKVNDINFTSLVKIYFDTENYIEGAQVNEFKEWCLNLKFTRVPFEIKVGLLKYICDYFDYSLSDFSRILNTISSDVNIQDYYSTCKVLQFCPVEFLISFK